MKVGSDYYFYQNDHLGTPQKLTAINGAVVWTAKYSSFGKATVEIEVVENPLRFAGQYEDDETGLHYNYHRYYDPETGRYIKADPIGLDGGINYFAYVSNSPINQIDFLGLLSPASCALTNCPCDSCEIFEEKNVPRSLDKRITDDYEILEYKIKDEALHFFAFVEGVSKLVYTVRTGKAPKYQRPPIVIRMPKTYHVESDLFAKFDCLVEFCPETMDRKEICTKIEGTEWKVFRKDWVTFETNVY